MDDSPLYVVFHPAASGNCKSAVPMVIATSLFEERKSAYSPLRRLAERLAAAGHPVLRFDYRGSGESGGHLARRRWQSLVEDLTVARQTLRELSGQPSCLLLGLRLGATLVLQQSHSVGVDGVIALAPIIVGATQVRLWKMRSKIRSELTELRAGVTRFKSSRHENTAEHRLEISDGEPKSFAQSQNAPADVIDFDGYETSPAFFNDVNAIDLLTELRPLSKPGWLIQISPRTDAMPESTQLCSALGVSAKLKILRMEPFWNKLDDVDTQPLEDLVLQVCQDM
ncbi:MAG: alpha/beta hydrolase [Planctomycetota bacterium]